MDKSAVHTTKSPPPVFVVGMPRSGTTLLSRLLESCGPYTALPESHFFSRFIWESLPCRTDTGLRRAWSRFAANRPWPLETVATDSGGKGTSSGPVERYRKVFLSWVENELARMGRSHDSPWVENSPPHLEGIPFIRTIIPEARILGIVRDPRAVHASLMEVDWNRGTAGANSERWSWYVRCLDRWSLQEPDQIRLICYEDLLRNTVVVLETLYEWLGITIEVTGQDIADTHTACFDPAFEPWKAMAVEAPNPKHIDKWRSKLSKRNSAIIERIARDAMLKYGYKPESKARHRPDTKEWFSIFRISLRLRTYAAATWTRLKFWQASTAISP